MSLKPAILRSIEGLGPEDSPAILLKNPYRFLRWFRGRILFFHERGFRIQKRGIDRCILFSDVQGLAVKESDRFANGIRIGTAYEITFTVVGEKVQLKHVSTDESPEPVASFIRKLIHYLADQYEMAATLQGEGWSLDERGFHSNDQAVAWNDIGYVDVIENHVNIWRRQETYPFARIPFESPQATVLNEILERQTKKNPQPGSIDSQGRFLFKRRANRPLIAIAAAITVALFLSGAWLLTSGSRALLPAVLLFFLSASAATYGVFALRRVFSFYQYGIIQEPGHRVLFYNRCESLVYDVNLQFINSVYAFTRIRMKLQDVAHSMNIRIQCYGNDSELEQTRVEIARKISERMFLKLATQQEVPWGRLVRIAAHEVRYLSTRLLGSSARLAIPFTQPISYSMDSGKFYLFRAGEADPVFEMDCAEENFYPGFFLLLKLVSEH